MSVKTTIYCLQFTTPSLELIVKHHGYFSLTQWGRVTHICVSKLTIIGSDNGLAPDRRQAIIWTNDGILLIEPLSTNVGEIVIEIPTFSFKKMYLKISSGKWRPFCRDLNVLTHWGRVTHICVSKQTIIGSDNGLLPNWRQAIIWTNAGILLIGTLGTNFSGIFIEIRIFSFKKMGLKVSSAKWRSFCRDLNVLTPYVLVVWRENRYVCLTLKYRWSLRFHLHLMIISIQLVWLTHWSWDNMAAILQTKFLNALSWMKLYEFRIRFHWSVFLRSQSTIFQQWLKKWLGADQATSHCLN